MKFLYSVIVNGLLFYFVLSVFNGIRIAGSSNITSTIIAGLVFGIMIAAIPTLLKFFKLPVTLSATFLLGLILTFVFLFLLYVQIFGVGSIGATTINLGSGGDPIRLTGAVQTMVVATIFTSLAVIGLQAMSKNR